MNQEQFGFPEHLRTLLEAKREKVTTADQFFGGYIRFSDDNTGRRG